MPAARFAPLAAILALLTVLGAAGVTVWPRDDGAGPSVVAPVVAEAGDDWPDAPDPDVARGACGVVTYTPPQAGDDHQADLCRPRGDARGAVILVHGGGGYSGDRSTMREWGEWYREQGFVTLSVDYSLLGDGGPEPVYPRPEQDLKAAVQWVRIQSDALGLDPQRILVHGSSAGARLAAQVLVTAGDPYFAGPDLWPDVPDDVAGLVGFYGYYDGESLQPERYYGGLRDDDDPEVRRRWRKADSVARAGDASGPVLLFHGDVDGLITVAQTDRFGAALAEVGADVTTFIVTDGDHAFDGRSGDLTTETGQDAAAEIEAWLNQRFP